MRERLWHIVDAGKVVAAVISLLGIGIVALPIGIHAAGFSEALAKNFSSPDE